MSEASQSNLVISNNGIPASIDHLPQESTTILRTESVSTSAIKKRITTSLKSLNRKIPSDTDQRFPEVGIMVADEAITDKQVDLIKEADMYSLYCQVNPSEEERLFTQIIPHLPQNQLQKGKFPFRSVTGEVYEPADCTIIQIDPDTTIYVSEGKLSKLWKTNKDGTETLITEDIKFDNITLSDIANGSIYSTATEIRSLQGSIKIAVKKQKSTEDTAQKIMHALESIDLGNALDEPNKESEKNYKESSYQWQHSMIPTEYQAFATIFQSEHGVPLETFLELQEVCPEYYTVVEPFAHERYLQDNPFTLTHTLGTNAVNYLPEILSKTGLLSTCERYKRGMLISGQSSDMDLQTGGGDYVFLRSYPKGTENKRTSISPYTLIINPKVLDRTDWHAYHGDLWGASKGNSFSPEKFFLSEKEEFHENNELMFKRGISSEMIQSVSASSEELRQELINSCLSQGVTEVNGVPIEEYVITDQREDPPAENYEVW